MRTRRLGCTLVATLSLGLAAGCGGSGPGPDAAAWTDAVCGALTGFTEAATRQPRVDPADPVAAADAVDDYLASTATALDRSISDLDGLGAAPVDGGDAYVDRLQDALTRIRDSFAAARTELGGIDTSSTEALTAAFPAVVAPLQELRNLPAPTQGLSDNDELRAAAEQAPNCRRLRELGTATS